MKAQCIFPSIYGPLTGPSYTISQVQAVSRAVREGGGSKGSCNAKELSLEDLEVTLGAQNISFRSKVVGLWVLVLRVEG